MSGLHLRLDQVKPSNIWFNHLTNLKELCLEFKGCHPRQHNYFAFLTTCLEKLSIIGHYIELNSLSYLSKLNFLEMGFINYIYIDNLTPFDCFKNLKTLRIEHSKLKFEYFSRFFYKMREEFEPIGFHFNLTNLEELDLNQMTLGVYLSKPFDNNLRLYFENLPKLMSFRLRLHSLEQINFDLFEKLLNLENLEISFHEGTSHFRKIKSLLSNLKQIKNLKLNDK